jgi:hypothetical protein
MISEISYLPIDVQRNRAIVLGPELEREDFQKFLEFKEQYSECFAELQSRFSKNPLMLKSICNGINFENLTGSNFLFANYFSSFSGKNLLNLAALEGILKEKDDFFSNFYGDLSELILFSRETNCERNKYILNHLVNQLEYCGYEINPNLPLVIPSPKFIVDNDNFDKGYGFLLELGKDAHYNNSLIPYKEKVFLGNSENTLISVKDGINRMTFMENELTIGPDLIDSCNNGRIVIIEKR